MMFVGSRLNALCVVCGVCGDCSVGGVGGVGGVGAFIPQVDILHFCVCSPF
jgi:hypothetical protein